MSTHHLPPKSSRVAHAESGAREGRVLQKGQQTKAAIVDAALGLATQIGVEGAKVTPRPLQHCGCTLNSTAFGVHRSQSEVRCQAARLSAQLQC